MTELINQITIDGQQTTFLNYVNPVVGGEVVAMDSYNWTSFFNTCWGTGKALLSTSLYLLPPGEPIFTGNASVTNWRFFFTNGTLSISRRENGINSSLTSAPSRVNSVDPQTPMDTPSYTFAVVNQFGFCIASFTSVSRTTLSGLIYRSYAKQGAYTANQRPRNYVGIDIVGTTIRTFFRPTTENTATIQSLLTQNPTLSCAVSTPGANATEVLIRDSTSPNNYIGQLWNMIRMPSSCVLGKVYKNTGVDPDTGVVETGQKAFWLCLGNWGTDKIGMRVWTENIT